MQTPLLKAAIIDRRVLYDAQHPTRRFFDTLAAASVDLKPDDAHDRTLIELAGSLAEMIRDEFVDDLGIFETAKHELDAFLDAERASCNQELAKAVPLLIAQDEAAAARDEAVTAIEARLAGRTVTPEIRAFLDNDCVERLTAIDLDQGSESLAWERQLSVEGGRAPVLARLAWRAPQRKRLLFSYRDGSTAFVHAPESLAEPFRIGCATLAIEAVSLFDRAMARLIDRRSQATESEAAVSA